MRNSVYACNLENKIAGICSEIDRDCVRYLTTHSYNRTPYIKEKFVLTDVLSADGDSVKQTETHTFAHPDIKKNKTVIKRTVTKRTMNKKLCYLNHGNEQICYTLNDNDMNFVKIEQESIFISEVAKPKTRKPRQKKYVRRSRMANLIKWEDLCFQQEIEAEYHCNVKPNDYAQYLNNKEQDPMFCQFGVHEKCNREEKHFYDFYMDC